MLEKMKEIIAEQLSVDAETVTEASSFKEDLGADSLDLFELVMALEDEYSVEIPAEDLETLTTVGQVMDYLKAKGVEAYIEIIIQKTRRRVTTRCFVHLNSHTAQPPALGARRVDVTAGNVGLEETI